MINTKKIFTIATALPALLTAAYGASGLTPPQSPLHDPMRGCPDSPSYYKEHFTSGPTTPIHSDDEGECTAPIIQFEQGEFLPSFTNFTVTQVAWQDISPIQDEIEELKAVHNLKNDEILFITDIDGTLTDNPDPKDNPSISPRGKAVEVVKELVESGVHVVASSAWNVFSESLGRLKQLDLLEAFGATPEMTHAKKTMLFGDNLFNFFFTGRVASAGGILDKFYRLKSVAPYVIDEVEQSTIKALVFVDDSSGNVVTMAKSFATHNIYPNLIEARLFFLTDAK